jgi:TatD DNase family protein
MRLIDSHAHLDFDQFDQDRETVIRRARQAGLVAIVNVGASLDSSRAAVALAEQYDFIYAAVGVHPHDARTVTPAALDELRALARRPKVVAVGEIGLDYYVGLGQSADLSPRPVQRRAFADQLDLATELELPVIIHSRDAHDDVIKTLREWRHPPSVRATRGAIGVFHTYSAGPEQLDGVLEMGFCVGLSGPVTFPKSSQLRAVAAAAPLERLLVETDCPYLTPQPYRGQRNEPAYVQYVVEAIAQARWESAEAVAQATADNARRLFSIP